MHWITILGIILIAAGTILACFGQNIRNRFVDKHLHQTISEKTFQIDELVNGKNKLLARINEYQEGLSVKDEIIQRLEAQVNESIVPAPGQLADEQIETSTQVIPETDLSDVIAQARSLCNEGKYDEAYKIADDLRRKNPDFGQAYFVLGTIEMRKERYSKGVELLNRAIHLELPNEDTAWAFHNLGIASLRKKDYEKAKEFLEKAVELNSNMVKSKSALKLLNDYLQTNYRVTQVRNLYNEGKYDDAYRIADGLREKNPRLGLAYYILGTIEMLRKHYDKGEDLLNQAIQLKLSNEDTAWAFHNLGISSLRKKDYEKAREFLEKAVELNSNMEESRKTLESLDDLQEKERRDKEEGEAVDSEW
ncbi:MAG: tetratricopeptide repeat protein [Candidatus Scalindua sp.]